MSDDVGDMLVARERIGVAGMLVEVALRLVECDLRQGATVNCLDELAGPQSAILEVFGSRPCARSHVGKIIKRLVMKLEVRHRNCVPTVERCLPRARIPRPG